MDNGYKTTLRRIMRRLSSSCKGVLRVWSTPPKLDEDDKDDRYFDFPVHKAKPTMVLPASLSHLARRRISDARAQVPLLPSPRLMPPVLRPENVPARATTRRKKAQDAALEAIEADQLARIQKKSVKRGLLVSSQVEKIGHGAINFASSDVYAGELKRLEGSTYPTGTIDGFLKEKARGVNKCSRLNYVTRRSYSDYTFPTMAFVNTELGHPTNEIGHAEIVYDVTHDRPTFELRADQGSSLRASGAWGEFERRYGGEANKAKTPRFAELLELLAIKNGVPLDDPSHITIDAATDRELRAALKKRAAARAARAPKAPTRTALYFFKRDPRFDTNTTVEGSATEQFERLPRHVKNDFEAMANVAKYHDYIRDLDDGEAESDGETEAPRQSPS